MTFDRPLVFRPLFMERVWGGRQLATRLGRQLPPDRPIGESWEIVDREEAQSAVEGGDFAGRTLHDLWTHERESVFGRDLPATARFPLLAKILDAREILSVQVHPPAHVAAELNGEPKTEMWHVLEADPGAELFAGFRNGTTRADFERALATGEVAELLHRIPVRAGDTMFIPSGRCHAIGAGCLVVEIMQNSDTTYRVFDWNRKPPRKLHIPESLASIDFDDHEPSPTPPRGEVVVSCPEFHVERWELKAPRADTSASGVIFTVLSGQVECAGVPFKTGDFFIVPAAGRNRVLSPLTPGASVLRTTIPTTAMGPG